MSMLRALSALLLYPTQELVASVDEIEAIIVESNACPSPSRASLDELLERLRTLDLVDLQEDYVDLGELYRQGGLEPSTRELADFLPLFLEYLSTRPDAEARATLAETSHVLQALGERLSRRSSPYAAVFDALLAFAATAPDREMLDALRSEADPASDDYAALDAAWEDEAVSFGPGAAGCGDALASKVRQGRRPAPGVEAQVRQARRAGLGRAQGANS
jgi:nitrate reductase delta subunit